MFYFLFVFQSFSLISPTSDLRRPLSETPQTSLPSSLNLFALALVRFGSLKPKEWISFLHRPLTLLNRYSPNPSTIEASRRLSQDGNHQQPSPLIPRKTWNLLYSLLLVSLRFPAVLLASPHHIFDDPRIRTLSKVSPLSPIFPPKRMLVFLGSYHPPDLR